MVWVEVVLSEDDVEDVEGAGERGRRGVDVCEDDSLASDDEEGLDADGRGSLVASIPAC